MPRVTQCTCALMCVIVCERVRACACVLVINENKHLFQDFCYLISRTLLKYTSNFNKFHHVRLFSFVLLR